MDVGRAPVCIRNASEIKVKSKAKLVITAAAMEKPLVTAFVVFPTASSSSRDFSTSFSTPDILAIPPALSTIGPKVSEAMIIPFISVRPKAAAMMPYKPSNPPPNMK
jgi:hypothetical protein